MHPTLGILARFQAFFYALSFFQSDGVPPPAPARVTQTVGRFLAKFYREKYVTCNSIADNIDYSLRAYVADKPKRHAPSVYVKNNKTGKIYEVYFGAAPGFFPLQNLLWLNKDTFFVGQIFPDYHEVELGSAWLGVAINFNKQEYVYYGIGVRCCGASEINCWGTPRPTP